ncbi:MAG: DNA polymerase III subunit gamma/tau [Chloroflexi bacterium]|nr:DNA polymerase III subunit gamma/tau [Chloroflexota bacterium]
MTSQALYRKWRPHLWDQVVSQEHVIQTLQNAIRSQRVGHAYLFSGPRGTGKTTTARLLAKAVNCLEADLSRRPCDQCAHCLAVNEGRFLDLIEIDAASNTSVDDIRDLRDKINFAPNQGRYKVYIIDEVHMLSTAAFNALLKTLEEPPPHAIFILATTEVHKIPATVLSRCQRHEFRRIPVNDIVHHLQKLCEQEKLEADPEALTLIARQSTGAMRDAISLLDQLASSGQRITLASAQTVLGTAASQAVIDLVQAILDNHNAAGLDNIHDALDSGTDPRQFARQVVDYLRGLLLIRTGNASQIDATTEVRARMAQQAQAFALPHLLETIRQFNQAATETRLGWQPGLLLEMATIESSLFPTAASQPIAAAPATATGGEPPAAARARPAEAPARVEQVQSPPSPPEAAPPRVSPPATAAPAGESPPAEPPTSIPPEATPAHIDIQDIRSNWRRIREIVKERSRPTEGLLNSCKLLTVRNGTLYIGFASEVLKSKMEIQDNMDLTCQAIYHVTGANLPIVCVVTSGKGSELPPDLDVDGDGLVNTALNLGGQISSTQSS